MKVLKATEDNFRAINAMAGRFIDDVFDMDEPFVSSMHMVQMCHDLGVLAVSVESSGTITGFVAGMTMPFVGNPDVKVMAEIAWWVEPEYRGGRSALALMNYLENQAHLQNCKHLSMFSMVGEHDAEPIYVKRGFALREKTFHKRLKSCQE